MKIIAIYSLIILLTFRGNMLHSEDHINNSDIKNIFQFTVETIDGRSVDLKEFSNQVLLVVNTATRCGFSGQLDDLEQLYQRYKDKGFSVLAFPSNDFGSQEPGDNSEVKAYCSSNFNFTYPMMAKNPVTGTNKQEVYKFLTEESADAFKGDPGWNFVKFLVNRQGQVVGRYSSMTNPLSKSITNEIEKLL